MLVLHAVVLPSISLLAILLAAVAALVAWLLRVHRSGTSVSLWDIAGACALIGCAAGILGEPEIVLATIGRNQEP